MHLTDIHAHVPYHRLAEHLEFAIRNQINPEVFFSSEALDRINWHELSALANALHHAGRATTIHAPFLDLNPGALDSSIREVARHRLEQTLKAAEYLKPKVIVVHPGFDELHYGDHRDAWLANSIDFWSSLVPVARTIGTVLAVENIFDKNPTNIRALLDAVDDPCLRHCFDIGHFHIFGDVSLDEWFEQLGSFVVETHLHDNHGKSDEHLPVGEGTVNFGRYFPLLERDAPTAVRTIEAHNTERLHRALKNMSQF